MSAAHPTLDPETLLAGGKRVADPGKGARHDMRRHQDSAIRAPGERAVEQNVLAGDNG